MIYIFVFNPCEHPLHKYAENAKGSTVRNKRTKSVRQGKHNKTRITSIILKHLFDCCMKIMTETRLAH